MFDDFQRRKRGYGGRLSRGIGNRRELDGITRTAIEPLIFRRHKILAVECKPIKCFMYTRRCCSCRCLSRRRVRKIYFPNRLEVTIQAGQPVGDGVQISLFVWIVNRRSFRHPGQFGRKLLADRIATALVIGRMLLDQLTSVFQRSCVIEKRFVPTQQLRLLPGMKLLVKSYPVECQRVNLPYDRIETRGRLDRLEYDNARFGGSFFPRTCLCGSDFFGHVPHPLVVRLASFNYSYSGANTESQ